MVRVVRRVAAERDLDALGEKLRHAPVLGDAAAALRGGDRAHRDLRARARQALDLGVVHAERVRQHHVRPEHAERLEVFGRESCRDALDSFARLGPASVVEGQHRFVLVRHGLGRAQEVRAARLRRERHGPRLDPAVESPLPLAEERGGALDRLVRGVAGQVKRRVLVGDALAHDHANPGVVVGLQARVRELRAAGIDEADRPALQELHDPQQGGVVLLFLGHRHLQLEHVINGLARSSGKMPRTGWA